MMLDSTLGTMGAGKLALLVVASGCLGTVPAPPPEGGWGWSRDPAPLVWHSTYTKTPPRIDGELDEVWKTAAPLTVMVREAMGGDHPRPVTLRALHTDDTFYIFAQWPDDTKSDLRDPYVWDPEAQRYERPSRPDDQFAIEFPMEGDFAISMLTVTREFRADVWHWKAGRGNRVGWVDDKYHVISQSPVPKAKEHKLHGGRSVYIARVQDAGTGAYKVIPAPTSRQEDVVDSFEQLEPTGSLADVRGKGVHDGATWSLEMSRKFDTGHPDDAVIDPSRDNRCAIAVLDDELYEEHSVSTVITLRFGGGANSKGGASSWNFDGDRDLPSGWKAEGTNQRGPVAMWAIKANASAPSKPNALALTDTREGWGGTFNLFWTDRVKFKDGIIEVKVKAGSGEGDQGGGPIWRARDKDNYYIARWNPLEDNFRVYAVTNGRRKTLDSATVKADPARWHTIRIEHIGDEIRCSFDGEELLMVHDQTLPGAGGVGVWTKADAATSFDDFKVTSEHPND